MGVFLFLTQIYQNKKNVNEVIFSELPAESLIYAGLNLSPRMQLD
jgi:hypothetical protein